MKYPDSLITNGRPLLSMDQISNEHRMYMRHKPGYDWNIDDDLPDFTKIKIDTVDKNNNQSFNWSLFSEPYWVRFDGNKAYKKEYAVIAHDVRILRNLEQYDDSSIIESGLVNVEHLPTEDNYSHCQLHCTEKFQSINNSLIKKIKRSIRIVFKNQANVILRPNQDP